MSRHLSATGGTSTPLCSHLYQCKIEECTLLNIQSALKNDVEQSSPSPCQRFKRMPSLENVLDACLVDYLKF